MNETSVALLRLLADGEEHGGEQLGQALGISRAAVWKQISALNDVGLNIASGRQGYVLEQSLELLDANLIARYIGHDAAIRPYDVLILPQIGSTNTYLLEHDDADRLALLTEHQYAGRGRLGRQWVSPPCLNICLSIAWVFEHGVAALGGLSLAVGVAACKALEYLGVRGLGLKWPNDLLLNSDDCDAEFPPKLGGILVEVRGESAGRCRVVAGIGINRQVSMSQGVDVTRNWTDLERAGFGAVGRNQLAARLIREILAALDQFSREGLMPFRAAWQQRDALHGRAIQLNIGDRNISGHCLGIDTDGALLLDDGSGVAKFAGGEVSVGLPEST